MSSPRSGRPTAILLGGKRQCECGCQRRFPRSKSSNGVERRFYDQTCAERYKYNKRIADRGTVICHCGKPLNPSRIGLGKSTCSKSCQTQKSKGLTAKGDNIWYPDHGHGKANQIIRAEYCKQKGPTGFLIPCTLYQETIGQGCYTGSCYHQ